MKICSKAKHGLFAIPSKPHYIFSIRDLIRVTSGLMLANKESVDNKKEFIRLWVHETVRVFYDRLVDSSDRKWFFEALRDTVHEEFKMNFEEVLNKLESDKEVTENELRNLIFTGNLDIESGENKKYEEISSFELFNTLANQILEKYNETNKEKLNIILFRQALENLAKICRILTIPATSGLLVGFNGSGRKSLTILAATIYNQNLFLPEITNEYGWSNWRNDLKDVIKEAGGKNRQMVFLLTEKQMNADYFLEDIDLLLNSGEITNLFSIDELEDVLKLVRTNKNVSKCKELNPLLAFNMLLTECKMNLHLILCLSPIGLAFRKHLRMYPSLINCCTINWFDVRWDITIAGEKHSLTGWSEDALEMVANLHLNDIELDPKWNEAIITASKYYHVTARELAETVYAETGRLVYITSSAYLDLLKIYKNLLVKNQNKISVLRKRYLAGIDKLEFAASQVRIMEAELEQLRPRLKVAVDETLAILEGVLREKALVDEESEVLRHEENIANKKADEANKLKVECERELAKAIPILEDAIAALNTLKPDDITLVKSMKHPPRTVRLVLAAVCVMKAIKPARIPDTQNPGRMVNDYWGPSVRMLGDMGFLASLKNYDKDNIPASIMNVIRNEYLIHDDFKPKVVAKASSAAQGMCKWVIAMSKYDFVVKMVAPKKAKLAAAEKEYLDANEILETKRKKLALLLEKLAALNVALEEAEERKQKLIDEIRICALKLDKAHIIIGNLGGEGERWIEHSERLKIANYTIIGDLLISCGIISYLAPFTSKYREEKVLKWILLGKKLEIPSTETYDFTVILGKPAKIHEWNMSGLPSDTFSIYNAIIMTNSSRWPLFIDPEEIAKNWIKNMENENNLEIIRLSHRNYIQKIENCIDEGKPILIENVGIDLKVILDSFLFKNTLKKGDFELISSNGRIIKFNPSFRFYITTKIRNPNFNPDVYNKLTVIEFSLNIEGLADQMLTILLSKDRPDLQENRKMLMLENAKNKKNLKQAEDNILITLSNVEGNVLEDEKAILMMEYSKSQSADIQQKQLINDANQIIIEKNRFEYKSISEHSSVLYYTLINLSKIDPMYQFSLKWFLNIYVSCIDETPITTPVFRRLDELENEFDYKLYTNVCNSIFNKDKILYSYILSTTILISENLLSEQEVKFLITEDKTDNDADPNPASWFSDKSWHQLCTLQKQLPDFQDITQHFKDHLSLWKLFYDLIEPDCDDLPNDFACLTPFQKLLLMKILHPEQLLSMIKNFVIDILGERFISIPMFDIRKAYHSSNNRSALIFLLSPDGSDPMYSLKSFAKKMGYEKRFTSISLGEGSGTIAKDAINEAKLKGDWICLQNCHIALTWLPTLENLCENLTSTDVDPNFRLWLTSYPSDKFPEYILQEGIKITNEIPTELRQNLLRSYLSEPVNSKIFYESIPTKAKSFNRLLFGIAFFHAIVQERGKFGPLGWNMSYRFDESDFNISILQLQMFLNESKDIPFEALIYSFGECNYGGKIIDTWDHRTMKAILNQYINEDIISKPKYNLVDGAEDISMPIKYGYKDFLNYIEELPQSISPQIFGLNWNANITKNIKNNKNFLNSLQLISGEYFQKTYGKSDNLICTLASDILNKIPDNFNLEDVGHLYHSEYKDSLNNVLIHEMGRFNSLSAIIRSSLDDVKKALEGKIILTQELEEVGDSLFKSKVPDFWMKFSYPSLKPIGSYINDFLTRIQFLQDWYENGKPIKFWLSGFFFTQSFLTGIIQNHARQYKVPIDQLTFDFEILLKDRIDVIPVDGTYVYGLFLEGARWDNLRNCLEEQSPKKLIENLPLLYLKPIKKISLNIDNRYICPLYKTSERKGTISITGHSTNYILQILLNSEQSCDHWIKRGVALICQLND